MMRPFCLLAPLATAANRRHEVPDCMRDPQKLSRKTGMFRVFRGNGRASSLQFRLAGGGRGIRSSGRAWKRPKKDEAPRLGMG